MARRGVASRGHLQACLDEGVESDVVMYDSHDVHVGSARQDMMDGVVSIQLSTDTPEL